MKITQDLRGSVTVGALATFLAEALQHGVPLDAPIEMSRGRASEITEMVIDVPLPGFEAPAAAVSALSSKDVQTPPAARPPRSSQRGNPVPDTTPAADDLGTKDAS